MTERFPTLGSRQAAPIWEKEYAPRAGDYRCPPDRELVAVIVNHGMGQQVPYETMETVAIAVESVTKNNGIPVVRHVRLGTEGKNDIETELVRVELQVASEDKIHEVHIYESYWAPLTEGKVTLKDVVVFLWDAGWNGILNTDSGTFKRWLFGSQREFKLTRPWLYVLLITTMMLLASLMLMNGVLTAAAASHSISGNGGFPKGQQIAALTSDFLLADLGAALIVLGTVLVPRLQYKISNAAPTPKLFAYIEWSLVLVGAPLILFAGLVMPFQLAGWNPGYHQWRIADFAQKVAGHALLTSAVWGIELVAAYAARWFLIEYVGDVAAYISAHTVSKFWELRQQIWQTAMKVADAVYRARTATTGDSKDGDFLYKKVIVVGHSLGSVIGYDVLNGLLLEDALSKQPLNIAVRTRMFLTFGSPLDKTAFLFKTQRDMNAPVRAVGAASVHPMIQNYANRPLEWINLWSRSDIISGHLDYYDPPTPKNARTKRKKSGDAGMHISQNSQHVRNLIDPAARTPFAAHVEYWTGALFAKELVRGIVT